MREIDVVFDPERKLFLYFGVALLAIGVGPFGTYEAMGLWQRTIFWTLDVLGGMAIVVPILHVFYHSRLTASLASLPRFFLGVALGALPTAGYITLLYGTIGADLQISTPFPQLYLEVTVFSAVLLLTEFVVWPAVFGAPGPAPPATLSPEIVPPESETGAVAPPNLSHAASPPATPQPPALLTRLPPEHHHAAIISISMQDHYAEVTTTAGTALILMRLADAIDLLEGYAGARIQRSHWVAKDFVEAISRNGRRVEVRLRDGRTLPIGATYLEAAQQQLQIAMSGASSP